MWGRIDERLVSVDGQDGLLCTGNLVGGNADEVRSLKCNLAATGAPTGGASFAMGYRVGSIWQWGQRVWRCYGDGEWVRLATVPSTMEPGQYLTTNESGDFVAADLPQGGGGAPMLEIDDATDWGTGADGAVVYSSNTTLTSDVNATTVVVNSGVTVSIGWNAAEGRPAVIKATVSITNNGTISANGGNGVAGNNTGQPVTGGSSLTGGGGGGGGSPNFSGTGGAGVSQRPGSNGGAYSGYNGGSGGAATYKRGGRGNQTTGSNSGAGGAGGVGTKINFFSAPSHISDLYLDLGGSGGGGGAGHGNTAGSGSGGGGGGGTVLLASPEVSSQGAISASGGVGPPVASGNGATAGGGGGGGVVVVCRSIHLADMPGVAGGAGFEPGLPGFVVIACERYVASTVDFVYIPVARNTT